MADHEREDCPQEGDDERKRVKEALQRRGKQSRCCCPFALYTLLFLSYRFSTLVHPNRFDDLTTRVANSLRSPISIPNPTNATQRSSADLAIAGAAISGIGMQGGGCEMLRNQDASANANANTRERMERTEDGMDGVMVMGQEGYRDGTATLSLRSCRSSRWHDSRRYGGTEVGLRLCVCVHTDSH